MTKILVLVILRIIGLDIEARVSTLLESFGGASLLILSAPQGLVAGDYDIPHALRTSHRGHEHHLCFVQPYATDENVVSRSSIPEL